jgi:hypothetical protein
MPGFGKQRINSTSRRRFVPLRRSPPMQMACYLSSGARHALALDVVDAQGQDLGDPAIRPWVRVLQTASAKSGKADASHESPSMEIMLALHYVRHSARGPIKSDRQRPLAEELAVDDPRSHP